MAPTISERMLSYILPGVLMGAGIVFFLQTAVTAPKLLVTNFQSFRYRAFSKLWLLIGPRITKDTGAVDPILAESRGVILDMGPGTGYQLSRFAHPENITTIYGAEPCVEMHPLLQENAEKAGLVEKYKILTGGVEPESLIPTLAKVEPEKSLVGLFDEIVAIRVLCSVPKLNETIECLYSCLKSGGRLVVYEHVLNVDHGWGSMVSRFFQRVYMAMGWPFWLGGCELTRDTTALLMRAAEKDGGWSEVKLEKRDEWSTIPHIIGYLIKK